MSPTNNLRKEHDAILAMLGVLEKVCQRFETRQEVDPTHLKQIVEFFQVFADKCHHGKEENHLYPAMEAAGVPREGGPIGLMLTEHDTGRGFVKQMHEAGEKYAKGEREQGAAFAENGRNYLWLLSQHIEKENNILYPMAVQVLPQAKQDELLDGFEQFEQEQIGAERHEAFHQLIHELQDIYVA